MKHLAAAVLVFLCTVIHAKMAMAESEPSIDAPLPPDIGMRISPGLRGDVLLYGYYNVRNGINIFSVVNTSPITALKARVRFREGERESSVFEMNLCMGALDRWTAFIVGDGEGPAKICPLDDDTVTFPVITDDCLTFSAGSAEYVTNDHTLEGLIEVIATVAINETELPPSVLPWTPEYCGSVQSIGYSLPWNCGGYQTCFQPYAPASADLMGSLHIVPLDTLRLFSYDATALQGCSTGIFMDSPLWSDSSSLRDCAPNQEGLNAVEYLLTKSSLYLTFDARPSWGAETEFVITFPTQWSHCDETVHDGCFAPEDLFDYDGAAYDGQEERCDNSIYPNFNPLGDGENAGPARHRPEVGVPDVLAVDDERNVYFQGCGFICPGIGPSLVFCNGVNVMGVDQSRIMDSHLSSGDLLQYRGLDYKKFPAEALIGQISLDFSGRKSWWGEDNHRTTFTSAEGTWTTYGLPALVINFESYLDGLLPGTRRVGFSTEVDIPPP